MRKKIVTIFFSLLFLTGCAKVPHGDYGIVTPTPMNNIKLDPHQKVEEESCRYAIIILPFGDYTIWNGNGIIFNLTERAINNAHKKGLQGDVLVNTEIEEKLTHGVVFAFNCITLTGYLVPDENLLLKNNNLAF